MTKRKKIPYHLGWAIEDIEQEVADIARYISEVDAALHDPRGVNKYLLMSLSSKIGTAVARIEKSLNSLERREGPPANGANTGEIDTAWLEMMRELVAIDTPRDALLLIVARKLEELS